MAEALLERQILLFILTKMKSFLKKLLIYGIIPKKETKAYRPHFYSKSSKI